MVMLRPTCPSVGGGGGIRTRDTLLRYTRTPGVRLRPLGHPSDAALTRKGGTLDEAARRSNTAGRRPPGGLRRHSPAARDDAAIAIGPCSIPARSNSGRALSATAALSAACQRTATAFS